MQRRLGNALAARRDPTSPSATTDGRKTTGHVGQAARPPYRGSSPAYVDAHGRLPDEVCLARDFSS